jgi:tetratricopeptide (TPR) repeat protein
LKFRKRNLPCKIILKLLEGDAMNHVSHNLLVGFYRVLTLVFLLLTSLAHAEERPENMDLKALLAHVDQLKGRLDRNPSDCEAQQGLGIVYYYVAIKDPKTYTQKAVQYLEQAYQKKPDDNVVLCYLGSVYTMLAKDASDPMSKLSYVNKGIEYMDKAIRKDPDNITVRLTRANNSKASPTFLNRRSIAYEDFEHLANLFEKGLKVPSQLRASVYRSLAALQKEDGNMAKAQKYQNMAETFDKEE